MEIDYSSVNFEVQSCQYFHNPSLIYFLWQLYRDFSLRIIRSGDEPRYNLQINSFVTSNDLLIKNIACKK